MYAGKRILAVVPARSGSKGVPHKNMRPLGGLSLIARAAQVLAACPWLDDRVLSTDDPAYAAEGQAHGLWAPFLRPAELSSDKAGAVETLIHALEQVESLTQQRCDVILIVEPTSPFRQAQDLQAALELLVQSGADSVVSVSKLDTKAHPGKVLRLDNDRLDFYEDRGRNVVARQSLEPLYYRNGVCYALTRSCLTERRAIFGPDTRALLIDRLLVNIDEPIDFEWAEFLLARGTLS